MAKGSSSIGIRFGNVDCAIHYQPYFCGYFVFLVIGSRSLNGDRTSHEFAQIVAGNSPSSSPLPLIRRERFAIDSDDGVDGCPALYE